MTPASRGDLSKFTTFTYDQARSSGLPPEVAAVVDEHLDRSVSKFVDRAVEQQRTGECFDGVEPCASFALTIRQEACQGYLCARVDVEAVPVGAAGGDSDTFVWVFDLGTGQSTTLAAAYGPGIGDRLQAAARRWQKSRGIRPSDYPANPADLTGWLPAEDGIRVWFPSGSLGPESDGVAMIVVPYDSPQPSPDPSPARVQWRSIADAPSDPLYVLVKDYQMQPDGSILLTVDPLSPDLAGDEGPWCGTWTFADPPGDWCLSNQRVRERKVTLLPDADVGIGDGTIDIADLPDYIAEYLSYGDDLQAEPISYLRLDARGFADQFVALGPTVVDDGNADQYQAGQGAGTAPDQGTEVPLAIVPNLLGLMVWQAEDEASRALLTFGTRGTINADPSIGAQINKTCLVAGQDPPAGAIVERGTMVRVVQDCPPTGFG